VTVIHLTFDFHQGLCCFVCFLSSIGITIFFILFIYIIFLLILSFVVSSKRRRNKNSSYKQNCMLPSNKEFSSRYFSFSLSLSFLFLIRFKKSNKRRRKQTTNLYTYIYIKIPFYPRNMTSSLMCNV